MSAVHDLERLETAVVTFARELTIRAKAAVAASVTDDESVASGASAMVDALEQLVAAVDRLEAYENQLRDDILAAIEEGVKSP